MVNIGQEMTVICILTSPSGTDKVLSSIQVCKSIAEGLRKDYEVKFVRIINNNIRKRVIWPDSDIISATMSFCKSVMRLLWSDREHLIPSNQFCLVNEWIIINCKIECYIVY